MSRAVVIGLARTGESVARHLRAGGFEVHVVDDDLGALDPARRERVERLDVEVEAVPTDAAADALVGGADLVVPSPGVPVRHPLIAAALRLGRTVRSEIDLAAQVAAESGVALAAVTGTNGKTTVTELATAMARAAGIDAVAAGNIGTPLLDAVQEGRTLVVAEVSSFQLEFTSNAFRPEVAALLNVADDHLDWHGSFPAYAAAKARVFRSQSADDVVVFNADDPLVVGLVSEARSRRVPFSIAAGAPSGFRCTVEAGRRVLVDAAGQVIVAVDDLVGRAPHDLANVLAAAAVASACGAGLSAIATAAETQPRPPHRLQEVAEHGGITFVDDSKATNVHAAVAAVRAFDRVVLIAGGRNKGLDLGQLAGVAAHLVAVVAIGEAAGEVERAFDGLVPVARASDMTAAVRIAAARARVGDVVLLSPACASFDWYRSYAERGADFVRAVRELAESEA